MKTGMLTKITIMVLTILMTLILTMVLPERESAAAINPDAKKINSQWVNSNKAIHGGSAGNGFSLLGMRQIVDPKLKIERFIFDVGDFNGQPLKKLPGYYHVELRDGRLFIDFSQMVSGNVTEKELLATLKKSNFIKTGSLTVDPEDKNLNITLQLKEKAKFRVFQVPGTKTTSKVVIDLSL